MPEDWGEYSQTPCRFIGSTSSSAGPQVGVEVNEDAISMYNTKQLFPIAPDLYSYVWHPRFLTLVCVARSEDRRVGEADTALERRAQDGLGSRPSSQAAKLGTSANTADHRHLYDKSSAALQLQKFLHDSSRRTTAVRESDDAKEPTLSWNTIISVVPGLGSQGTWGESGSIEPRLGNGLNMVTIVGILDLLFPSNDFNL